MRSEFVQTFQHRVKVCGLRDAASARVALGAGADALGFVVFERSPRHVTGEAIRSILESLEAEEHGEFTSVAVLVDATPEDAARLVLEAGVDAVQLCGSELPRDWADFPGPILRRLGVEGDATDELQRWCGVANAFVLDHPGSAGGSGLAVERELATDLVRLAHATAGVPCLLAGGLDGDSVQTAVERVRPHGVDASSKLELDPGRKDPTRIRHFVERSLHALDALDRLRATPSHPHGRSS